MYQTLLIIHSYFRWLVLASLLFAMYSSYKGWLSGQPYKRFDNLVRHNTATIVHIQFLIGICLYFVSPIVAYFLDHFSEAVHDRQLRFFGMEHITMMVAAVSVISIGSSKAKRKETDREKFKTTAIWFTIGLFIILSSIPWPFPPFAGRPLFRTF